MSTIVAFILFAGLAVAGKYFIYFFSMLSLPCILLWSCMQFLWLSNIIFSLVNCFFNYIRDSFSLFSSAALDPCGDGNHRLLDQAYRSTGVKLQRGTCYQLFIIVVSW